MHDKEILAAVLGVCRDGGELLSNIAITTFTSFTDKSVQFSIANMLVYITNSFDKPDKTEEREQMEKLGCDSPVTTRPFLICC